LVVEPVLLHQNSLYSRAKRVLEMAVHEGKDLGQNFVGTEHIF
jgi:hypothetical protein